MKLLALATLLTLSASCHGVTPDQFADMALDCAGVNPANGEVLAAVETCLASLMCGAPAMCLTGLAAAGRFAKNEVACVVAAVASANPANLKMSGAPSIDTCAQHAAATWLAQEHIRIK